MDRKVGVVPYSGGTAGNTKYFFPTPNGSVHQVAEWDPTLNGGLGGSTLLDTRLQSAFGEPILAGISGAATNAATEFGYTGRRRLGNSGLYDYRNRIYDPALGRFLTPDPLGTDAGMNLYGYVSGDPVNKVDPWGLDEIVIPGRGVVTVPGDESADSPKGAGLTVLRRISSVGVTQDRWNYLERRNAAVTRATAKEAVKIGAAAVAGVLFGKAILASRVLTLGFTGLFFGSIPGDVQDPNYVAKPISRSGKAFLLGALLAPGLRGRAAPDLPFLQGKNVYIPSVLPKPPVTGLPARPPTPPVQLSQDATRIHAQFAKLFTSAGPNRAIVPNRSFNGMVAATARVRDLATGKLIRLFATTKNKGSKTPGFDEFAQGLGYTRARATTAEMKEFGSHAEEILLIEIARRNAAGERLVLESIAPSIPSCAPGSRNCIGQVFQAFPNASFVRPPTARRGIEPLGRASTPSRWYSRCSGCGR